MGRRFRKFRGSSRNGVAVVEFLFAAPAFFILTFFVMEIALVWSDRHIMRLAAYRAARTVVKMRAELPGAQLCWGDDPRASQQSLAVFKAAQRSSSKVMATITPSITQLLTMFGNPLDGQRIEELLGSQLEQAYFENSTANDALDRITSNPYVHAIFRMMKGMPAAITFTELQCKDINYPAADGVKQNTGVEVQLKYHRSAKMPYVGTIMWFLRSIQSFYEGNGWAFDGVRELIRINPLNYGLEFKASLGARDYEMAKEQIMKELRERAIEQAKKLRESASQKIGDLIPFEPSTLPSGDVVGEEVGKTFDEVIRPKLDEKIDYYMSQAQDTINSLGEKALEMLVLAPDELKTIPISVAVRIPNYSQTFVNEGSAWDGRSSMIGRFANGQNMTSMAKGMGQTLDSGDPPNGGTRGVPYVGRKVEGDKVE